jgi:hypothetical protein
MRLLERMPFDPKKRASRIDTVFHLYNYRVRTTGVSQIREEVIAPNPAACRFHPANTQHFFPEQPVVAFCIIMLVNHLYWRPVFRLYNKSRQ